MDYRGIAAYTYKPFVEVVGVGRVYFMDQHFNINFLYCFIHADSSFKNTKSKKLVEERSVCGNMFIHSRLL